MNLCLQSSFAELHAENLESRKALKRAYALFFSFLGDEKWKSKASVKRQNRINHKFKFFVWAIKRLPCILIANCFGLNSQVLTILS